MRTLGTNHSRAIVKIIQDRSLPPPLEICEIRFEVNNEQDDKIFKFHILLRQSVFSGLVRRYLATPGIISRLSTYVHTISSLWRVIKDETNNISPF